MEAKEMESQKMLNLCRLEECTNGDGPANNLLCSNYAQCREWKFAQFQGYI